MHKSYIYTTLHNAQEQSLYDIAYAQEQSLYDIAYAQEPYLYNIA